VRGAEIGDARDLCGHSLPSIHVIELTFTTPTCRGSRRPLRETPERGGAAQSSGGQARTAVSGRRFLVPPGQGPEAAAVGAAAERRRSAVVLGAFTPSEVMTALALGSDAVKIFPAHHLDEST